MTKSRVRGVEQNSLREGGQNRREGLGHRRLADHLARRCHDEKFEAHRGAFPWNGDVRVNFGNDGHRGERAKKEIALVRAALKNGGVQVLGFGRAYGYTWTLLVRYSRTKA